MTEREVLDVQQSWADAIAHISKTYKEKGDYIGAAGPFAHEEDGGFAINGGKGWASVVYDNHAIALKGDVALAMGEYDFTCATTGDESKVEYTFGYQRCDDGKVRIFLHHSSVPFSG